MWKTLTEAPTFFQKFFFENFQTPDDYIDSIFDYTKSLAINSLFCHYIGLGDRHCDNLVITSQSGQIYNIDFDCIFERAKQLPVPEKVSFRLTRNIVAPLGAFQVRGLFEYYMVEIAKFLQKNKRNILINLSPFYHDQLYEAHHNDQNKEKNFHNIKANLSFSQYESIKQAVA